MSKTTPAAKTAAKTSTTETGDAGQGAPKQTRNYKVVSHLDHDGESFEPGATVELTKRQAAPLLGHTVVEVADDE